MLDPEVEEPFGGDQHQTSCLLAASFPLGFTGEARYRDVDPDIMATEGGHEGTNRINVDLLARYSLYLNLDAWA